jgi:DNA-directed RNA polymerase subunit alpha
VREDGTQLALNIKGVRLRSYTDRAVTMQLLKQQAGPVFAGDIDAPSTIEIVNPQHYLCTIDDNDTFLEMQLIAERGRGVSLADQASGMSLGEIAIDALFNPIVRVNFLVEEAAQSTVEDPYERLILEIWTDGTLKPGDALSYGAQILSQHFSSVAAYNEQPPEPALPATAASSAPAESYDLPIDTLDLSTRTYNSLRRAGITSVGQLLDLDERELYSIRNLGPRSAEEIRVKLKEIGYQSSGELPPELMAAAEQNEDEPAPPPDDDTDTLPIG